MKKIRVRHGDFDDSIVLSALLNEIIAVGGTTAYQKPVSVYHYSEQFYASPDFISLFVAQSNEREIEGFQYLQHHPELPSNWGSIATFAKIGTTARGIGTLLFHKTRVFAYENKIAVINATIRADNESGLRYYSKMGFKDYAIAKAVPLDDGTLVDRISKKLVL